MDSTSPNTPSPGHRADVIAWSQAKGGPLKAVFDETFQQIQEGSIDEEELKPKCDWYSSVVSWDMFGMPKEIRDAIAGEGKELATMVDRKALLEKGNFVEFILGSYVKRPTVARSQRFKTTDDEAQELSKAFGETFLGTTDEWLSASIGYYNEMYMPSKHYGKQIVYVQSSGTGKSRTLHQFSKQELMLTVCFRDIRNLEIDPLKGWPPGDKPICQFFTNPPKHGSRSYKAEELVGAFMGALMSVVAETLKCIKTRELKSVLEDFHKIWEIQAYPIAAFEGSKRYNLFKQVAEKAGTMLKDTQDELRQNFTTLCPVDQEENEGKEMRSWLESISSLLIDLHARALQDICEKYPNEKSRPRLHRPFIFAFDECKELDNSNASLIALQTVIKALDNFNMWHILVDTSSGIQDVRPMTGNNAKSHRLRSGLLPLPVFPYIQWDLMLTDTSHYAKTPSEALEFRFLKRYGRPYWATLKAHDLLEAAKEKLLCSSTFQPDDNKQVFAVFSARLLLELGEGQASQLMAVDAVESHMRILTGMANREIVFTCAPSEPMLAVAAAAILLESEQKYQTAMRTLVRELILKRCVIDRGHQGELLARILLMLARDAVIASEFRETAEPTGVGCVNLADFLTELLGKKLACDKENKMVEHLLTWAKKYHLNFTHFYQLSEHIVELSPEFLFDCWRRGVAITCTFGQAVYDILLVTYCGGLNEAFDESKLGLVAIQVKLRGKAATSTLIDQLTCPILVINEEENLEGKKRKHSGPRRWKPEHLVMLMDLGTNSRFRDGCFVQVNHTAAARPNKPASQAREKKPPSQTWQGYLDQEPERYSIWIRGQLYKSGPSSVEKPPAIRRLAPALVDFWELEHYIYPAEFQDWDEDMQKMFDPFLGKLLASGDILKRQKV